jgi:hypothetical protein
MSMHLKKNNPPMNTEKILVKNYLFKNMLHISLYGALAYMFLVSIPFATRNYVQQGVTWFKFFFFLVFSLVYYVLVQVVQCRAKYCTLIWKLGWAWAALVLSTATLNLLAVNIVLYVVWCWFSGFTVCEPIINYV